MLPTKKAANIDVPTRSPMRPHAVHVGRVVSECYQIPNYLPDLEVGPIQGFVTGLIEFWEFVLE